MTPDRLDRFARHIVLPEVGGMGQDRLAGSHVVLVGMGGIGNPALQYLAGAGVGRLTLVDSDVIEASNLQRQTLFCEGDVGRSKVEAAAEWLIDFDREIDFDAKVLRVTAGNARDLVRGADLVVDGCDNFATRLAVSDACVAEAVPLTSAALGRFQGQVANFAGHREGEPCYRCFVGDAFDAEDCDTCAEQGVLGAMVGMVGAFAAMHAIRALLERVTTLGDPRWGQLYLFNGLKPDMRSMRIAKDASCSGCGSA
jgi:molybdopterin/thiamine biosynthesis adenylyltransferase